MMLIKKLTVCTLALLAAAGAARAQGAAALLVPGDPGTLSLGLTHEIPGRYEVLDAKVAGGLWAPGSAGNTVLGAKVGLRLTPALVLRLDGKYFSDKPYEITNAQGSVTGSYSPSDMFFSLGGSFRITEQLSLGLDARVISSSLAPSAKATGFCGDIHASYGTDRFTAVLSARNLGPGLDYGNGASPLPSLVSVSGSVSPADALRLFLEADYLFSGALMAGIGAEYGIAGIAFVRAGYHYGDPAKALAPYASLGLGAAYSGFSLDLAFLTASETLGNTLMLGLGYSF